MPSQKPKLSPRYLIERKQSVQKYAIYQDKIQNPNFSKLSTPIQASIWRKYRKYAQIFRQLNQEIQKYLSRGLYLASLSLSSLSFSACSQYYLEVQPLRTEISFEEQTGSANPFYELIAENNASPSFVDIDADGDLDVFLGNREGLLLYYENTGSLSHPVFEKKNNEKNPFKGKDIGARSAPAFADLDGDGDMDALIGEELGSLHFFQNLGTSQNPDFQEVKGGNNPFKKLIEISGGHTYYSNPVFADLDEDGDSDLILGQLVGEYDEEGQYSYAPRIRFFENLGGQNFKELKGLENPFGEEAFGNSSNSPSPFLMDLDQDGDLDVFIAQTNITREGPIRGTLRSQVRFFENKGSLQFSEQVEASQAINQITAEFKEFIQPTFANIDQDGDAELFLGTDQGIRYYKQLK